LKLRQNRIGDLVSAKHHTLQHGAALEYRQNALIRDSFTPLTVSTAQQQTTTTTAAALEREREREREREGEGEGPTERQRDIDKPDKRGGRSTTEVDHRQDNSFSMVDI
jgi:hypothetical protein